MIVNLSYLFIRSLFGRRKITIEECKTLVERRELILADRRCTAAHTFAFGTCRDERDSRHTIVDELVEQLFACPISIGEGEEESIANGLVIGILVIHNAK